MDDDGGATDLCPGKLAEVVGVVVVEVNGRKRSGGLAATY